MYEDEEITVFGDAKEVDSQYKHIHEGSIKINGTDYSVFEMLIEPIDPLDPCSEQLDFTWSFEDYSEEQL